MHGVRRDLLLKQAKSLGLDLFEVRIPKNATNSIYEQRTKEVLQRLRSSVGYSAVAFGDLFLADIRSYREKLFAELDMKCIFPIWGRDTSKLAKQFVESGFRGIVCCVDPRKLGREYCGREFDSTFLSDIPKDVDPCGENGEFHTFVYAGPIFSQEIKVSVGDTIERDGFFFADILPRWSD